MRPDQLKRLEDLTERLADSFLLEADPAEWPGDGTAPADLTQEDRGNRYWCKKNAMATGGVLRFAMDVLAKQAPGAGPQKDGADDEADMDRQIKDAERRAARAMSDAVNRAQKKPEFIKRAVG